MGCGQRKSADGEAQVVRGVNEKVAIVNTASEYGTLASHADNSVPVFDNLGKCSVALRTRAKG